MSFKPVIFLAFANDKVDNARYLRNLSVELHGIRKSLAEAVSSGLCDVVERTSTTVSDIMDVFQDPMTGPRVSIFHYGGHADGFSLLLESEKGEKALTHKDGLVPFLARQENLKLVFLNGCSSEGQTSDMLKAGIPAVIGTTSAINDEIATSLSTRFYSSLGDGGSIDKAWIDATDEIKIKEGTGDTRALVWEGKTEKNDRFPWIIQFRPGSDSIKKWNLPDISGNPLYGLPPIPTTYTLPEIPFLYLNRYERKHAEVFFGRSNYIRSLYASINEPQAPSIILLYGQSGVGKSSLLEAGLQPRLESKYEILYLRRDGNIGLSNTLYNALLETLGFKPEVSALKKSLPAGSASVISNLRAIAEQIKGNFKSDIQLLIDKITASDISTEKPTHPEGQKPTDIAEAWKQVAQKLNKPVVVILDQLEEAYTRPNAKLGKEMNQLFVDLKNIFGTPSNVPQCKIILSFRKEYQPEIDELCKNYELSRSRVFVEHIAKNDVLEVFKGFTSTPRLQTRYNLQVEDGLGEIIAADLSTDSDAPIAPMLQILLTKLWIKAVEFKSEAPTFIHAIYYELKEEGLAMDEFLQNQLNVLRKKLPALAQNGFVLDLLSYYCTPNNTSAARTDLQLRENYPTAIGEADLVLRNCKELYLITDLGTSDPAAMLAHDTLAKSVVKLQSKSAQPIQQARRVLASRIEAVRGGSELSTLDEWDLKLIDGVKKYLPGLAEDENKLLDTSRAEIQKKQRDRKLLNILKATALTVSVLGAALISFFYSQSKENANNSLVSHMAAASINHLTTDPTLALKFAAEGMDVKKENSNSEIKKALTHAFYGSKEHHTPWYKSLINTGINYSDIITSQEAKRMIPFSNIDSLEIMDFGGHIVGAISIVNDAKPMEPMEAGVAEYVFFEDMRWSRNGKRIVAMTSTGGIQIHDQNGVLIKLIGSPAEYFSYDISPYSDEIIAYDTEDRGTEKVGRISFFDMEGKLQKSFYTDATISTVNFAGDAQHLLLTRLEDGRVEVIDPAGKHLNWWDAQAGNVDQLLRSKSGQLFVVIHQGEQMTVWNTKGKMLSKIMPSFNLSSGTNSNVKNEFFYTDIHANDSLVMFCFRGNEVRLFSVYSQKFLPVLKHDQMVTFAIFSPDGQRILTGSADNTAAVWDIQGHRLYQLLGHTNDVTGGLFSDKDEVVTTSLDGTVLQWKLGDYYENCLLGHIGPVTYLDLDSEGRYLVSCGVDHTMRIWDTDSQRQVDNIDLGAEGIRYATFIDKEQILGITEVKEAFIYKKFSGHPIMLKGHRAPIQWAGWIGDIVVTASDDSTIRYWDMDGTPLRTIRPVLESASKIAGAVDRIEGPLLSLDVSSRDSLVAIGSEQGPIFVYNEKGEQVTILHGHDDKVTYIDFSNDGRFMVSASQDRSAIVWDMKSLTQKARLERIVCAPYNDCLVRSAAFSNDGNHVITTSSDRTIRLWDLQGKFQASMIGHTDEIEDAFFGPADQVIYSFSADKTIKLWDLTGKEVTTYRGHTSKVNYAIMANDLNHVYSASDDGTIRTWYTPIGVYHWMKDTHLMPPLSESNLR